jgi:hypothetical protein
MEKLNLGSGKDWEFSGIVLVKFLKFCRGPIGGVHLPGGQTLTWKGEIRPTWAKVR